MGSPLRWFRIVVVVATVAACTATVWSVSSAEAASGAVVVPAACQLLSPSDLQALLGVSFGEPSPTETPGHTESACTWIHGSDSSSGYSLLLEVQGLGVAAFREARSTAKGGKYNPYDTKFRAIKHLGDDAFSHQHRNPGFSPDNDVVVRKAAVIFSFVAPAKHVGLDRLKKLAAFVLTRA